MTALNPILSVFPAIFELINLILHLLLRFTNHTFHLCELPLKLLVLLIVLHPINGLLLEDRLLIDVVRTVSMVTEGELVGIILRLVDVPLLFLVSAPGKRPVRSTARLVAVVSSLVYSLGGLGLAVVHLTVNRML